MKSFFTITPLTLPMTDTETSRSKVAELIKQYEMEGVGMTLETRWTREEDRWSLRDLAGWFNQQLLKQAMEDAGVTPVDGEVSNNYRLLTDDNISEGDRIQLRRKLEQAGVDVDTLLDDFVTYQAIRTYLKEVRNATYDRTKKSSVDSVQQRIDRLVGRTTSVTEGQLKQLQAASNFAVGSIRVLVDVQVYCEECNSQYEVAELLERGGCDCDN